MSYHVEFKGIFRYADTNAVEQALSVIDIEEENPDYEEMNILERSNFKLDPDDVLAISIDFSASIPASTWYGCRRVICKMSKNAIEGEIRCSFEGDADEWVDAGSGWD